MFTVEHHHYHHDCSTKSQMALIRAEFSKLKEIIMATQAELASDLATVTGQITKIGTETRSLLDKVVALQEALSAAGSTTPEVDSALVALKAQVVVVDGLVPDAAEPDPIP